MREFHMDTFNRADGNKPQPTLDSYKGKPRQSYYYLPILPKFNCSAFNSGTKEQKIEAINKYIKSITAQFGRLAHNIKANNNEKEDFYRPHYNYNVAQRNLAYQCKSAIEYGGNVEDITYSVPTTKPDPPKPSPKPKPKPLKPTDKVPKPKPPPIPTPMGGGGGGFIPPSFCDVNPDNPKCKDGGKVNVSEPKSKSKKTNLLLLIAAGVVGYYLIKQ